MTNPDRVPCVVERLQHGATKAARRIVILHDDHAVPGRGCRIQERLRVDRLHRVQVHDPSADAIALQLVCGLQAVVQCHAGANQRDLVIGARPNDLSPADRKGFPTP